MFSRLKDEEDDATVSKGHVPWEVELLGDKRLKMVETDVSYAGERPSMLSFVFQFRDIVFRFNGSVLPFVLIECFIAVALSFIALYAVPDEEFSHLGHQFVGMLVAFLAVFRSQSAWTIYQEGRLQIGVMVTASRAIATEILGTLEQAHPESRASLEHDAAEAIRLLKLLYYVSVEHMRSSDGFEAWNFAHHVALSHATAEEAAVFVAEFGHAQKVYRKLVLPVAPPGIAVPWDPPSGIRASAIRLENRFKQSVKHQTFIAEEKADASSSAPTAAPTVAGGGAGGGAGGAENGKSDKAAGGPSPPLVRFASAPTGMTPPLVRFSSDLISHFNNSDRLERPLEGAAQRGRSRCARAVRISSRGDSYVSKFDVDSKLPAPVPLPASRPQMMEKRTSSGDLHRDPSDPHINPKTGAWTSDVHGTFKHNPHDPTRGKALLVVTWLRMRLARISSAADGAVDAIRLSRAIDTLLGAYAGMHKVDNMVLPLPYCQLLKIVNLAWVFSLPFVLAAEMKEFLPAIMLLASVAIFGLDQVGAELEGPYGVDDNDFPLLHMGIALVDDLDVMLRTAERAAMAGGPPAGAPEKSVHMGTRKRPSSRETAEQVMEA